MREASPVIPEMTDKGQTGKSGDLDFDTDYFPSLTPKLVSTLPCRSLCRTLDAVQGDDLLHFLHANGLTKIKLPDTQ